VYFIRLRVVLNRLGKNMPLLLFMIVSVALVSPQALPAVDEAATRAVVVGTVEPEAASAVRVLPAPGGGEMILVGPELDYAERVRLERDGRSFSECTHLGGKSDAPPESKVK